MIRWDVERDEFLEGQWMEGKVFLDNVDVSPDGRYIVYEATNYRWTETRQGVKRPPTVNNWTAVSKPPYWTALIFNPESYCGYGGGQFGRHRQLFLNRLGEDLEYRADKARCPFIVLPASELATAIDPGLEKVASLIKRAETERPEWVLEKVDEVGGSSEEDPLTQIDWSAVDSRGRNVFTSRGKLFVLEDGRPRELADFSSNVFQLVAPPEWAKEW
jgi:hypothetical protein